jgi:hypothetical protein
MVFINLPITFHILLLISHLLNFLVCISYILPQLLPFNLQIMVLLTEPVDLNIGLSQLLP